jgi:hypothetical protein
MSEESREGLLSELRRLMTSEELTAYRRRELEGTLWNVVADFTRTPTSMIKGKIVVAGATEEEGAGMAKDKEVLFTVRALDPRDVYIERGLDGELLKVRVSAPPSSEGDVGN